MAFLTKAANRGSIATGYDIENSLKFEPDNSEYLSITNTSAGNRRTATYSFWLKRTELDASSYMQVAGLFTTSETTRFMFYQDHIMLENGNGGTRKRLTTNAVYRDTSAFYHFVVAIDTTQSTAANRVKLYVNGVQETSFSTEEYPDQNFDLSIGQSGTNFPWRYGGYDATYYKIAGYLAEAHYIDGTQYAASDFGEFDEDSGIWKPKQFTGNYGTQGSYLNFSDASNLGANPKGSDIDAVLNNITSADQALDTPTNNFCTLLATSPSASYYKRVKDGGTSYQSVTNAWASCWSTIPLYSGKWYAEFKRTSAGTGGNIFVGAGGIDENLYYYNIIFVGHNGTGTTFSVGLYSLNGDFYSGSGVTGSSYATGDIICLAVDQDNGAIYFRKNNNAWMGDGTNAGNPASGASRTGAQIIDWGTATNIAIANYANTDETEANYGGYSCMSNSRTYTDDNGYGLFVFEPPTGYLAICSKNLAEYG